MAEYMKTESSMGLDDVAPRLEKKTESKDKNDIRNALKNDLGEEFDLMPMAAKEQLVKTVAESARDVAANLRTKVDKDNGMLGKANGSADETLKRFVSQYNAEMTKAVVGLQGNVEQGVSKLKDDLRQLAAKASSENTHTASLKLDDKMRRAGA